MLSFFTHQEKKRIVKNSVWGAGIGLLLTMPKPSEMLETDALLKTAVCSLMLALTCGLLTCAYTREETTASPVENNRASSYNV